MCCIATSDTHRGLRWCSTSVAIRVQLLPSSSPKTQKLSEAGALLGLWRRSTSHFPVFFVSSFFLFLCFFFLSVTSSSFLLTSLPRRCSITNDSLGDGVFFYIYFTHRSVQSHCDLDMPAQRGKPGRRTRMLRSIAAVMWTALELEVERTFEDTHGVLFLRLWTGIAGTTMLTLRDLMRHAALSWVHTSGLKSVLRSGCTTPRDGQSTGRVVALFQRQPGHLTQRLQPPRPSPSTLPDSDHAGGVLLQRLYVDSGS